MEFFKFFTLFAAFASAGVTMGAPEVVKLCDDVDDSVNPGRKSLLKLLDY